MGGFCLAVEFNHGGSVKKTATPEEKNHTEYTPNRCIFHPIRSSALKAPLTYKEIEDVMEVAVWHKVDKNLCIGGRDPYASSAANSPTSGGASGISYNSKRRRRRNKGRRGHRRGAKGRASTPDHP